MQVKDLREENSGRGTAIVSATLFLGIWPAQSFPDQLGELE